MIYTGTCSSRLGRLPNCRKCTLCTLPGVWFDGDSKQLKRRTPKQIEEFAPPVVMDQPEKYRHLLVPPEEWTPHPPPLTWVEPTLAKYGFNETHLDWGGKPIE